MLLGVKAKGFLRRGILLILLYIVYLISFLKDLWSFLVVYKPYFFLILYQHSFYQINKFKKMYPITCHKCMQCCNINTKNWATNLKRKLHMNKHNNIASKHVPQQLKREGNLKTCPVTDVTLYCALDPRKVPLNSWTSVLLPPRLVDIYSMRNTGQVLLNFILKRTSIQKIPKLEQRKHLDVVHWVLT